MAGNGDGDDRGSTATVVDVQQLQSKSAAADAGAQFVLESKGTWWHAGYHLASATAGPPLLSLPYAIAALGWGGGVVCLLLGGAATFYASLLLSRVMEHLEARGKRSLRYRDLAAHLIGYNLSMKVVAPLQFMVCFIAIIACILLGGQTMKQVLVVLHLGRNLKLFMHISIFGSLTLILSQLPSLHSLRHLNLLSTILCLGFSTCAFVGSIYAGASSAAPNKDYTQAGTFVERTFAVFNSISIMISAYANPLIVEIQVMTMATLVPPIKGKMVKGLVLCYIVALVTFFSVAISGYWAFGKDAGGIVFDNMLSDDHVLLVPKWLYLMGNLFACMQLVIIVVLYLQPMFEKYEGIIADTSKGMLSLRNVVPRLVGRSIMVAIASLIAAMLPFFAEFSAFMGAFGFTPICIILPLLLHNLLFYHATKVGLGCQYQYHTLSLASFNYFIALIALVVVFLGTIASFRQIILNAKTYRLFADI